MTEDRKALGNKIQAERATRAGELYGQAARYGEYAEKFKTGTFGLRKGLHMMFKDAAESANGRAYDAAHGYGHFAYVNAQTPQECEIDAQRFIDIFENRRNMPRDEFRRQVQFLANKALDRPRYEMPVSERERVKLGRDIPKPKSSY